MKTTLEKKNTLFKYLGMLYEGYKTGNFSELFPYLAKDCVFESQWVLTPNIGYDAIVEYLNGKGATLQRTKAFPSCEIMELIGNINIVNDVEKHTNDGEISHGGVGLYYEAGELCLLMEQKKEEETIGALIRMQLNDDETIKRIDLCDPALFQYRCFFTYVDFVPTKNDEEFDEGMMRISEPYYSELYLFLGMEGFDFDEYGALNIPMPVWNKCVERWKEFYSYNSFDEAFENICKIDYGTLSAKEAFAKRVLSNNGFDMWQNRLKNGNIIDQIIEWTNKYKDQYAAINSHGF